MTRLEILLTLYATRNPAKYTLILPIHSPLHLIQNNFQSLDISVAAVTSMEACMVHILLYCIDV